MEIRFPPTKVIQIATGQKSGRGVRKREFIRSSRERMNEKGIVGNLGVTGSSRWKRFSIRLTGVIFHLITPEPTMSKTITITEKKSASSAELFVKALLEQTDQEILLLDPERNVFAASRPARDAYRIARSATSQRPVQKGEAKPIRLVLSHSPLPPVLPSDELIPVQEGNRRVGYLVIRKKGDGTDFDFLTGVAGRKLLEEEFNHRNRERSKEDRGLVLVFIDLDQFKPVNDKFGHLVGDQVLLQFATLLKNSFRPTDLVARYGGDEFILLCENCPLAVIRKRIEEFRKNLANRYVAVSFPGSGEEGEKIRLGFSYGMTEVDPGDSFEVAVHNADQGLAQMKKGR